MLVKFLNIVFYNFIEIWQILMIINIILSLVVATFNTFKQYKIKRFLIFSSMTHIGYILLGITTGTIEGIQSIVVYFIIYIVSILNIWSIYIYFNNKIKYLSDLSYVYKYNNGKYDELRTFIPANTCGSNKSNDKTSGGCGNNGVQ